MKIKGAQQLQTRYFKEYEVGRFHWKTQATHLRVLANDSKRSPAAVRRTCTGNKQHRERKEHGRQRVEMEGGREGSSRW